MKLFEIKLLKEIVYIESLLVYAILNFFQFEGLAFYGDILYNFPF